MKVVLNKCYGGFGLSFGAVIAIAARKEKPCFIYERLGYAQDYESQMYQRISEQKKSGEIFFAVAEDLGDTCTAEALNQATHLNFDRNIDRDDPDLVAIVEDMGELANGEHAELQIVEIPDDVDYVVEEYDGREWIAEVHRTWR